MADKVATAERPAGRRSDGKRSAILAGACRVFLAQGFGGASMDEVAAAAGVSKMTVYRYFRSKEELLAGVVGDICNRIVDDRLAETMAALPLQEALRAFGRRMLEIVFAPETLGLHRIVIAESQRFPELGRLFYDSGPGASIATLAAYLRRHRDHPALKIEDPQHAAEEFMELLRGYEHMRALLRVETAPSPRKFNERIERAMRHLLRGR